MIKTMVIGELVVGHANLAGYRRMTQMASKRV